MSDVPIGMLHSGGLGDIIYSLPVARVLSADRPVIFYVKKMCYVINPIESFNGATRLLKSQPWIKEVKQYKNTTLPYWQLDPNCNISVHLDLFRHRLNQGCREHVIEMYMKMFNVKIEDWKKPWLFVQGPKRPTPQPYVLVSRSERYHNFRVDWKAQYNEVKVAYNNRVYFIGTEVEHRAFVSAVGPVPHLRTVDLLEVAQYVKQASLVLTNQTSMLAIAQSLGVPYRLEASPGTSYMIRFDNDKERLFPERKMPAPSKKLSVIVPQGLGDIYWCYQKLAPYFDEFHLRIGVFQGGTIENRSEKLVHILPKVKSVSIEKVSNDMMQKLFYSKPHLVDFLDDPDPNKYYTVNGWLYDTPIENIDPTYDIEWNVPLPISPDMELKSNYVCLYVSQGTLHSTDRWSPERWAMFTHKFMHYHHMADLPVILIGAHFDLEATQLASKALTGLGHKNFMYMDHPADQFLFLLKHATVFLGFQSGLNIMADALDTNQLIVYMNHLTGMTNLWAKPWNRGTIFNYAWFKESDEDIIKRFKLKKP